MESFLQCWIGRFLIRMDPAGWLAELSSGHLAVASSVVVKSTRIDADPKK